MPEQIYIGQRKLVQFVKSEEANLVAVEFEDGEKDEFSLRQFNSLAASEPYEEGQVLVRKWNPLVAEILAGMLNDGMKLSERDTIFSRVDASIINAFDTAVGKVFDVIHPTLINIKKVDAILKQK